MGPRFAPVRSITHSLGPFCCLLATLERLQGFGRKITAIYEMSSSGRRLPATEGVRGLAVLLVFFVHFDQLIASMLPRSSVSAQVFHWAGTVGHSGVDLFFLLSGHLIYAVLQSGKRTVWGFFARRIHRIYPTFLVVLALYVIGSLVLPLPSKIPHGMWPALCYLAENVLLLPGLFTITPLLTVAWSLSYEALYYVSLSGLYWAVNLGRRDRPARVWLIHHPDCRVLRVFREVVERRDSDAGSEACATRPNDHVRGRNTGV